MPLCNTEKTYGTVSKMLHWLIALMVLVMLAVGVSFSYLPKNTVGFLMPIHKSSGITLLILMVLRLIWRWFNPTPRLPKHMKNWEIFTARLVHALFYVLLIVMPITGIVMTLSAGYPLPFWTFGNIQFAFIPLNKALSHVMADWHEYLAWTIGVFFVLHTLAALKHHFYDKDDVLRRIV